MREYYQRRFDYILVDEYQDTNARVRADARCWRRSAISASSAMTISPFTAGAARTCAIFWISKRIFRMRKWSELEAELPLDRQYPRRGESGHRPQSRSQGQGAMDGFRRGRQIGLYHALDEREEAAFVARKANDLIKRGRKTIRYCGIVSHERAVARAGGGASSARAFPYSVYGGQKFYERKEVKDLIAYMRALVNPDDDVSCRRIINSPKSGIGDARSAQTRRVQTLGERYAASKRCAGCGKCAAERAAEKADRRVCRNDDRSDRAFTEKKPGEFFGALLDKTGYVRSLEADKTEESNARIEDI